MGFVCKILSNVGIITEVFPSPADTHKEVIGADAPFWC